MSDDPKPIALDPYSSLIPRQQLFVDEYLMDLRPGRAALAAGYKSLHSGSQLMRDPDIKAAIEARLEQRAKAAGMSAEWVLRRAALLASGNIMDFGRWEDGGFVVDLEGMPRELGALITELETRSQETADGVVRKTKLKLVDPIKALEVFGKHVNISAFVERIEHDVTGGLAERMRIAQEQLAQKRNGGLLDDGEEEGEQDSWQGDEEDEPQEANETQGRYHQ